MLDPGPTTFPRVVLDSSWELLLGLVVGFGLDVG